MAILQSKTVTATNKAGGKGEIYIEHILGEAELADKCNMYAKVTVPPGCSLGEHEHHGNTETYFILQGKARYNNNGTEMTIGAGAVTYCPDGEKHAIENIGDEDLIFMALIIKS